MSTTTTVPDERTPPASALPRPGAFCWRPGEVTLLATPPAGILVGLAIRELGVPGGVAGVALCAVAVAASGWPRPEVTR